LREWKVAI